MPGSAILEIEEKETGLDRPTQLNAGQMLSHYRIESWLGEGAMGVVYLARDTHLDRPVAIKVLRPESTLHPERRKRFVQEAKAASALNHPNIITIYDIGAAKLDDDAEGVPIDFIAMEYIEGDTLAHLIGRKGLAWAEALTYAVQMADALAAAHNAGLVHRDLKPANIMVTGPASAHPGLVKILDFGLAKLLESTDSFLAEAGHTASTETVDGKGGPRTERGTIVGTVAYMSPEQAEGKPVDARSDIFSCGSVLYEMLTGKCAFQGDTRLAILSAILRGEPQPISMVVEGLPPEMEQIIGRCLRKEPERRYQSAADLRMELQEIPEHARRDVTAPGLDETALPPKPKVRVWPTAALLVLLAGFFLAPKIREWIPPWAGPARLPVQKQVAVLPFQNVGGDPANQAFCDGLAESLSTALTQLEQFQGSLWVVAANEVRRESIAGVREAQRAFGVNLVITGSVQRLGEQLRVTANLVDARSVLQLGARSTFTRLEDIASLQDWAVGQVAELLEVELQPQARSLLAAGNTTISSAYSLYLQGRGFLQSGKLEEAISNFREAVKHDSGYALADAALGEAALAQYKLTKDPKWLEEARAASQRAIAVNDRLPSAHVGLGMIQTVAGRYDEAIRELRRALELNGVQADALRELASAYAAAGRLEEAESTYQRAIQLRPNYWLGYKDLGIFHLNHGRYPDVERSFQKVIELIPDHYVGYRNLGALYHLAGRYGEAEEMFKKSIAIRPTNFAYLNLGTTYYFQGRYRDAVAMNEKALELGAADYVVWGNLADAYRWTPEFAPKAPETYRRAIQMAERSLAINPSNAVVLSSLGVYWAKLGNRERALAELDKARRLAPGDSKVGFKAALVYELAGNRELALKALEGALKAGYSVPEVRGEPELGSLRKDPRCERLLTAPSRAQ